MLKYALGIGFGKNIQVRIFIPEPVGTHAKLLLTLLSRNIKYFHSLHIQGNLKHKCRFPYAGLPANQYQ